MNISAFRKDLKQAFDDSLHGEAVIIERGGVNYQLIADGVFPKLSGKQVFAMHRDQTDRLIEKASAPKVIKTPDDAKRVVAELCPGHDTKRWNCGRKGCKFA